MLLKEIKDYVLDKQIKKLIELDGCLRGWVIPKHVLIENGYNGNISLATSLCKITRRKMDTTLYPFTVAFDNVYCVAVCLLFDEAGSIDDYNEKMSETIAHLDEMSI